MVFPACRCSPAVPPACLCTSLLLPLFCSPFFYPPTSVLPNLAVSVAEKGEAQPFGTRFCSHPRAFGKFGVSAVAQDPEGRSLSMGHNFIQMLMHLWDMC